MTLEEFKNYLITASNNGTLLTAKHDPYNLGTTYSCFRTVLSHDLADNLSAFLSSGKYTVTEYENKNKKHSPYYFEITPYQDSGFTVPSSGVTSNSIFASSVVDKIIAVPRRTKNDWHLFGEDSSVIQTKSNNGDLLFKNNLT